MFNRRRSFTATGALLAALAVPLLSPTWAQASDARPSVVVLQAAQAAHAVRVQQLPHYTWRSFAKLRRAHGRPTAPPAPPAPVPAPAPVSGNPLASRHLAVSAGSSAQQEADRVRSTNPARARGLDYIAAQSTATWWGDWNPMGTVRSSVAQDEAAAHGATPIYVVYDIMQRDGAGYSAGGAANLADYRAWIDQFVAGVGSHPAAVVLEPDAVNDLYSMTGAARADRITALRYALTTLKAHGIPAYLDAGGPSIHAPDIAAGLLTEAGVDLAQGFSVNVSNFQSTTDDVTWGKAVSARVRGKHFVVDTGRNGNGATPASQDAQYWCNPPGRALGHTPTASTGDASVDAFLWIKQPGESDGQCRGFASAGTFSADYAYGLYAAMAG